MADVTIGLECEISNDIYYLSSNSLKQYKQGKIICQTSEKSPINNKYSILMQYCDLTNIEHVTGPLHVGDLKMDQQRLFKDCLIALRIFYMVNMNPEKYGLKPATSGAAKGKYRYIDITNKATALIKKESKIKEKNKPSLKVDDWNLKIAKDPKSFYVNPIKKAPGIHANVGIVVGNLDKLALLFRQHIVRSFMPYRNRLLSRYNLALSAVDNMMNVLKLNTLVKRDKECRGTVLFLAWYMVNRGAGLKEDMRRNNYTETDIVTYRKNSWGVMPKISLKTLLTDCVSGMPRDTLTKSINGWKKELQGVNFKSVSSKNPRYTIAIADKYKDKFKKDTSIVQKLCNCFDDDLVQEGYAPDPKDNMKGHNKHWSFLELGIIKTLALLSDDDFEGDYVEDLNKGANSYKSFKLNKKNAIIVECRAEVQKDTPICDQVKQYIHSGNQNFLNQVGQSLLVMRNINSSKAASRYHW